MASVVSLRSQRSHSNATVGNTDERELGRDLSSDPTDLSYTAEDSSRVTLGRRLSHLAAGGVPSRARLHAA